MVVFDKLELIAFTAIFAYVLVPWRQAKLKYQDKLYHKDCIPGWMQFSPMVANLVHISIAALYVAGWYLHWDNMDITSVNDETAFWLILSSVTVGKFFPAIFFNWNMWGLGLVIALAQWGTLLAATILLGEQDHWVPFGCIIAAMVLLAVHVFFVGHIWYYCNPYVNDGYEFMFPDESEGTRGRRSRRASRSHEDDESDSEHKKKKRSRSRDREDGAK